MTSVTAHEAKGAKVGGVSVRKLLEWGGVAAGIVLIAFGIAAIVLGANGRSTVGTELQQQKITGSDDMTPAAIKAEAADAGLKNVNLPTCNVAGQSIDTGGEARCFAQYMRIHALESSNGLTYAEMGRFATADGNPAGTSDTAKALKDAQGNPVANSARNTWVTETALSTALNTSYMAEQLANFGIVVGVALLLSGIGFSILALGGALRRREAKA